MGKFEITKRKNGDFMFNLKAGNGQVILTSQGYSSKAGCENGIQSVQNNCGDDKCFDRKEAKSGQPYFSMKSTNGQIIGSSEMYESNASCENGIASIKKNAPDADTVDLTK